LDEGLIEELAERPDPDNHDERRRYYRLTKAGGRAAGGEAEELRELLADARIKELDERPHPDNHDERRRYYRLTKAGRRAAAEEAKHLEKLLADARSSGLVPTRRWSLCG